LHGGWHLLPPNRRRRPKPPRRRLLPRGQRPQAQPQHPRQPRQPRRLEVPVFPPAPAAQPEAEARGALLLPQAPRLPRRQVPPRRLLLLRHVQEPMKTGAATRRRNLRRTPATAWEPVQTGRAPAPGRPRTRPPAATTPIPMTTGARPGTRTLLRLTRNPPWTGNRPRAPATAPLHRPLPQAAAGAAAEAGRLPQEHPEVHLPGRLPIPRLSLLRSPFPNLQAQPTTPGRVQWNRPPASGWWETRAT